MMWPVVFAFIYYVLFICVIARLYNAVGSVSVGLRDLRLSLSVFVGQVEDYAHRKQMEVAEVERWLGPILGYDTD